MRRKNSSEEIQNWQQTVSTSLLIHISHWQLLTIHSICHGSKGQLFVFILTLTPPQRRWDDWQTHSLIDILDFNQECLIGGCVCQVDAWFPWHIVLRNNSSRYLTFCSVTFYDPLWRLLSPLRKGIGAICVVTSLWPVNLSGTNGNCCENAEALLYQCLWTLRCEIFEAMSVGGQVVQCSQLFSLLLQRCWLLSVNQLKGLA